MALDSLEEQLNVHHSRGDLLHYVSNEVKFVPWAAGMCGTCTGRKNYVRYFMTV